MGDAGGVQHLKRQDVSDIRRVLDSRSAKSSIYVLIKAERDHVGFSRAGDCGRGHGRGNYDHFRVGGDARQAIRALLHDLTQIALDSEAAVSRGLVRGNLLPFKLRRSADEEELA